MNLGGNSSAYITDGWTMMNLQLPEDEPHAFEGQATLALLLRFPSSTCRISLSCGRNTCPTFAHAVSFTISHVPTWVPATSFP